MSHYPTSVAVTWQTSVDRLSDTARRLLERLAWLGPEPIPETLLEVPVPGLSEPEGKPGPASRDALAELETYSLATRSAEALTFTVHRLVQDVTRRSQRVDPAGGPLAEALRWVDAAFEGEPQDVRSWPTLDPLSPHARIVVAFADKAGFAKPTARLMNNLGQLLKAKALHAEAEPLMRRALEIYEKRFGPDHPHVARVLNNLAQLLKATNRLAEAEPLMHRALKIDEKRFGADHPEVAIDLNNLARLLHETNRLAEAEPLMERVVRIFEKSFGEHHPNVAIALNNLAQLLQATNRLAEAEPLMWRALEIDETSFGTDHPKVATRISNLAGLLRLTNRLLEAELLIRRALVMDEKSFGPDHPEVATDLNNLAQLLQAANRLAEAETLMRRAFAILLEFGRRNGHQHPNRELFTKNYRILLQKMGKSPAEIEAAIEALVRPPG